MDNFTKHYKEIVYAAVSQRAYLQSNLTYNKIHIFPFIPCTNLQIQSGVDYKPFDINIRHIPKKRSSYNCAYKTKQHRITDMHNIKMFFLKQPHPIEDQGWEAGTPSWVSDPIPSHSRCVLPEAVH